MSVEKGMLASLKLGSALIACTCYTICSSYISKKKKLSSAMRPRNGSSLKATTNLPTSSNANLSLGTEWMEWNRMKDPYRQRADMTMGAKRAGWHAWGCAMDGVYSVDAATIRKQGFVARGVQKKTIRRDAAKNAVNSTCADGSDQSNC